MSAHLLSALLAFVSYSLLNISQAVQKIGLGAYQANRARGASIWVAGTLGTSGAAFVGLYAVSLGSVAVVGSLSGTGLASLALFSAFVMREPVTGRDAAAVAVLLTAGVLVGAFSRGSHVPAEASPPALFLFSAAVTAVYAAMWLGLRRRRIVALIIGGFAGTLGGLVPPFQKMSTSSPGRGASLLSRFPELVEGSHPLHAAAETLLNPYALAWILLSVTSMVVLQFAHRRDKAIHVIPIFTASYLLMPVLSGVIAFDERLRGLQWLGIALLLGGVLLLTVRSRKSQPQRRS